MIELKIIHPPTPASGGDARNILSADGETNQQLSPAGGGLRGWKINPLNYE